MTGPIETELVSRKERHVRLSKHDLWVLLRDAGYPVPRFTSVKMEGVHGWYKGENKVILYWDADAVTLGGEDEG